MSVGESGPGARTLPPSSSPSTILPTVVPFLSAQWVAEAVADRLCGFVPPGVAALSELLIALDPASTRLAKQYERRLRHLLERGEDPIAQFERLTGRAPITPGIQACNPSSRSGGSDRMAPTAR